MDSDIGSAACRSESMTVSIDEWSSGSSFQATLIAPGATLPWEIFSLLMPAPLIGSFRLNGHTSGLVPS